METRSMAKRRRLLDENVDGASESVAPIGILNDGSHSSLPLFENTDGSSVGEEFLDSVCQSSFESLPRELASMIIEYAPESVHDLRLTSKTMHSCVDATVMRSTSVEIVEEIAIEINHSKWNPVTLELTVRVPTHNANLFELRLKLGQMTKLTIPIERRKNLRYDYRFQFTAKDDIPCYFDHLKSVIGKRIGELVLPDFSNTEEQSVVAVLSQIREGTKFSKLSIHVNKLSENYAKHIFETIKASQVEHLDLGNCANSHFTIANPVQFLLKASSLVKSIVIRQWQILGSLNTTNYLFGACDVDWPSTIFEMFSGSLDKLCILNYGYPWYLKSKELKKLAQQLPCMGKKVIFFTFSPSQENLRLECDCINNGHYVKIKHGNLTIKHVSRENERIDC